MDGRQGYVLAAELILRPSTDDRAPGGAVTSALCGHWKHERPCRGPQNNTIDTSSNEVTERIETALREGEGWELVSSAPRALDQAERELAARLGTAEG